MDLIEVIILGIIEGITEFLPVSSTGHMIIAQKVMNIESTDFVKAFTVIIQFGAILSVVVLYYKRFIQSFDFYLKLFIAFIPAAVLGLLFSDLIDNMLESVWVVAIMLIVGGVVMLFVDKWFNKEDNSVVVGNKTAFKIGLFQTIAMIPGVSRSMATIVGGMSQGLTRKTAAEFSFFLAVPTMFAATSYKVLQLFLSPNGIEILKENATSLIVGNIVAFIVALLAIKLFIQFVTKHGFKIFGYYRIVVGIAIIILLLVN